MKLSLSCLGSTAAVVMVGSAGPALVNSHKAETDIAIIRNCPSIVATGSYLHKVEEAEKLSREKSRLSVEIKRDRLRRKIPYLEATIRLRAGRASSSSLSRAKTAKFYQPR